ncbi:helix-turn-helix domain-containing protein [Nocardia sp. CA-128927]|uniref:helix-turn-helix domain-containing protein n=1 Tax=Nocardia sp. CA-128927 TaxID=3239975 RepID=UPI003D982823
MDHTSTAETDLGDGLDDAAEQPDDEVAEQRRQLAEELGLQIKVQRTAKKLTRVQLAAAIPMNLKTLQRIENGDTAANINQLFDICRALDIAPSDLINPAEKKVGIKGRE